MNPVETIGFDGNVKAKSMEQGLVTSDQIGVRTSASVSTVASVDADDGTIAMIDEATSFARTPHGDATLRAAALALRVLAFDFSAGHSLLDATTLSRLADDWASGEPTHWHMSHWASTRKAGPAAVRALVAKIAKQTAASLGVADSEAMAARLAGMEGDAVASAIDSPALSDELRMSWNYARACGGDRDAMGRLSAALARQASVFPPGTARETLETVAAAWRRLSAATVEWGASLDPYGDMRAIVANAEFDLTSVGSWASAVGLTLKPPSVEATAGKPRAFEGPVKTVLDKIGDSESREGQSARLRYGRLLSPLPLKGTGCDADTLFRTMRREFPWMAEANEKAARAVAVSGLTATGHFRLPRPVVLVGPPGVGKSRWPRRLAKAVGVPFSTLPLAGSNSSASVSGVERGFSGGTASHPAHAFVSGEAANPLVLVDEVGVTGESRQNGNPLDALRILLEPETSSRYPDSFLLGLLDLSDVSWVLTCNTLEGIPRELLDRCDVVAVPRPPASAFDVLHACIVEDVSEIWRIPASAMPDMSDTLDALRSEFQIQRSARALRAGVETALGMAVWQPKGPRAVA